MLQTCERQKIMTAKATTTEWCPRHGTQEFYNTDDGLTCPVCIPQPGQPVDEFTMFGSNKRDDERDPNEKYARWFLMLQRLPAIMRSAFAEQIGQYKLFCTYEGERYRVISASRFGQITLTKDMGKALGYAEGDVFTYADKCSGWNSEA